MYHLVDEIKGNINSRMVMESFEYFQDLKEYVVRNTEVLYSYIPGIDKYPDYTSCRSYQHLKQELEKNSYMDWGLTALKSEDKIGKSRRVLQNLDHTYRVTIQPLATLKRARFTDNGVSCKVGEILSKKENNVILHATQYRVVHKTEKAVLIEWLGEKGSTKTWIPNYYLK